MGSGGGQDDMEVAVIMDRNRSRVVEGRATDGSGLGVEKTAVVGLR